MTHLFPASAAYAAAQEFLYSRINYETTPAVPYRARNFQLRRMHDLLERLGNPERKLRVVHVAGTKGKGSTAAMLASVLTQAGFRTGLYTSPHLERLEERIVVAGQVINTDDWVQLVDRIRPIVLRMDSEQDRSAGQGPTFFDITTAMALLYFADQRTDAVVLEVGMGGRLDSTNVCQSAISVITSISFDHTKQLGNTLALIAGEKAGIIKSGVPVVTGVQLPEPLEVIEQAAANAGSRLYRLGREFDFEYRYTPGNGQGPLAAELDYVEAGADPRAGQLRGLPLGLAGQHQARNAAVAIATLLRLQEAGWPVPTPSLRQGLAAARIPARIEVLAQRPTVIVDVAHNVASIEALVRFLGEHFPLRRRTYVFAVSQDKDAAGMLRQLLPTCGRLVLTRFQTNPRSTDPARLAELATSLADGLGPQRPEIIVQDDCHAAWQLARTLATEDDLICIAGSFFLAADLRGPVLRETAGLACAKGE